MSKTLVSDLRHLATIKAGEITPRHNRLLSEAANHIELAESLLRDKERDNQKWRKRALEAESRLKFRGSVLKG